MATINLIDSCNAFALFQKMLEFLMVFDGNSLVIICSCYL